MPYDEHLAERMRKLLARRTGVTEKKMFGGLAFMLNGHMACGVMPDGRIMVRLGNEGTAAALDEPHAQPMDFTGKVLKSMVFVEPAGIASDVDLKAWLNRGIEFATTLPPK